MFVPRAGPVAKHPELHRETATNVRPRDPNWRGGRGEFPRKLFLSRPLALSQRGEGRVIAHATEAAGPPRPIVTRGSLEVTSA